MRKILHMIPPEVNNGVCRYIFNHMPFIDQSEYEFSFLTKASDELKQTEEYQKYHFPIYRLNGVQRNGREKFEYEVRDILRKGFDIIHLHTSAWRGFLIEEIAMDMGIPKVIVHSHSSGVDIVNEALREETMRDHRHYKERFSMKYATDVCACSRIAADWLFPEHISRDRIQILPNAVDVDRFRFNARVRKNIRKGLGIEERVVIGNVGRYSFSKNQEFLVRSFAKAYGRNKSLFLILIGQGDNIARVRQLVDELGMEKNIRCYGWKENIPDFLQAMDLFCLPSKFEGLPISVVEAQAAGLRCLVSDTVTKETDLTGKVEFIPLKMEMWAEAIADAESDSDRRWMDDYFNRAGYSMEASCKRLLDIYDSVRNCES